LTAGLRIYRTWIYYEYIIPKDSNLVPNENFSEILLSSSCARGQVTWAKMAKILLHL